MTVPIAGGVPKDIPVEADGSSHSTLVPIGVSPGGTVVSVECHCTPRSFEGFSFHELSFDVVRLSMIDVMAIQNRQVARKVMPKSGAYLALTIVLASYERLIRAAKPEYIYRCSAFTGLQAPPLRKHRYISESVDRCGYHLVDTGRDKAGRSYWLHKRGASRPTELMGGSAEQSARPDLARFFSDRIHGEMRIFDAAATAKHKERVKIALQACAQHAAEQNPERSAA